MQCSEGVKSRDLRTLSGEDTAAMLEDAGHRVVTAYSGRQALDILSKGERFDLLATDQAMPGMTGAELVEAVRSKYPDMAVALMTGYAELPPGVAGGVPRLTKPFMQTQLLAFLGKVTTPR